MAKKKKKKKSTINWNITEWSVQIRKAAFLDKLNNPKKTNQRAIFDGLTTIMVNHD